MIRHSFSLVKRPCCEADHSPPCSDKFRNKWSCTSSPPYAIMAFTGINLPLFTQPDLTCLLRENEIFTSRILVACLWHLEEAWKFSLFLKKYSFLFVVCFVDEFLPVMVTVSLLPKKYATLFWNPNVLYRATKYQPLVPIPNQLNSVHFVLPYFFNIDFNIILLPNHRSFKWWLRFYFWSGYAFVNKRFFEILNWNVSKPNS